VGNVSRFKSYNQRMIMTRKQMIENVLLKRIKKTDGKVNYKNFHLDSIKEVEKSRNLVGDSYVDNVLGDMSYEDIYSPFLT